MQIAIIGYVRNTWKEAEPGSAELIKKDISEIEILSNFEDGLYKIENFPDLNIFFYFHKSDGFELQTTTRSGDFRGVFSTCSPRRPSLIGMTSVRLVERKGNILRVTGLDALDGTPVLDIKPVVWDKS
ncbi:MAG TPA: SAM-dependent methyltransferase [Bacteroidales bacterium]|nr:SAM-dependent methyltransferase [Bacteroidales bacterium]HPF02783.1 SAM-dependent methyltransferase [Bacteroidales bacterium]HPJ58901.1 SAM-dependent methyltransferase [Bacteroidales bacterium]HPR12155.1 SAM-dependent methyltransferase [Bacteroidales bacterium]HRW84838.1 SAM-dependent methyltransferase [Bacteroidales bacterium]